jgi:hypothetical protein
VNLGGMGERLPGGTTCQLSRGGTGGALEGVCVEGKRECRT